MGTTLTGTTPQDTYDSLIKVTDNGPIGATPKLLSDGLGNDSSLALTTSFTSVRGGQQLRVYRTDNATYGSIQYLTGAGGFKFDDANGDGYTFAQGASTPMAITSTGNVGIGTSSPNLSGGAAGSSILTVSASTSARNGILELNGTRTTLNDYVAYVRMFNNGAATPVADIAAIRGSSDTTGSLTLSTSNAERIRIDASGNCGIGTDEPSNFLHISDPNSAIGGAQLTIEGRATGYGAGVVFSSRVDDASGALVPMAKITADGEDGWTSTVGTQDSFMRFFTTRDGSLTEKMRISSAGNVGIGTSAPVEKLDVIGGALAAGNGTIRTGITYSTLGLLGTFTAHDLGLISGGVEQARITSAGSVGIGTSTPQQKLQIGGNGGTLAGTAAISFGDGNSGGSRNWVIANGASASGIDQIGALTISRSNLFNGDALAAGVEIARFSVSGISFNGDTAEANALNDYEEGTFTATITPSTSGTITSGGTFTTWTYTKIGRQVTINGVFVISSVSSPVGTTIIIGGLPFTILNNNGAYGAFSVSYFTSATSTNSAVAGRHSVNTTQLTLGVDASTVAASDEIYVTATYFV